MNRPMLLILPLATLVAACEVDDDTHDAAETPPAVEYVNPRSPADGEVLPFSGAVWVGHTLHLSGYLGLESGQVPETAEQEATNVLDNVKSVLETAGLTMDDLVVVQVYASDVGDYDAFNGVYRTYFTTEFPARAFLGSGTLLFGARFEVMGIAVRREAAETG
ncbi:MAG: RidA family protein [Gemmatimonadota bacterium]|nr:RidA family protein [Gemmatimonadota bacterium]MDE2873733.1 RidA family protein [Gemmatimonadota bacterium]